MNKKNGFISMTLVYTFLVLFMFLMLAILTTYLNKDKYLEAINSQIDSDISNGMKHKNKLINAILKDNPPYEYSSIDKDGKTSYSFKLFNVSSAQYHNGNGLFYSDSLDMTDEDNNGVSSRIYFFRGSLETNHLIFAEKCWRIIRNNEDGSLRIRYNGEPNLEGACPIIQNIPNISIGKVKYSNTSGNVKYVTKEKQDQNGNYIADVNNPHSNIKDLLDSWYKENISKKTVKVGDNNISYHDYVSGAVYCNDTSGNTNDLIPRFINPDDRNVYDDKNITNTGSFKCVQLDDQNTRHNQTNGNKLLNYPIGTLTAQELVFAGAYFTSNEDLYKGGTRGINNTTFHLYSKESFWTMSAIGNQVVVFDSLPNGTAVLRPSASTEEHNVIPVISLKSTNEIESGTGTSTNPYIIKY